MNEPPPTPENAPESSEITVGELLHRITPRAWVTPLIAALIVVGFVVEIALGVSVTSPTGAQLLVAGGNFGPSFVDGGWWRAFASMFLHAGLLHIAFNVWAFWSVGLVTERVFGNAAFLALYLLSGFGGALASLTFHPLTVSVGASGAVFGVYGALLAFVALHRGVFPPAYLAQQRNSILGFLGYNVVFGLAQHNTDMAAHAGGFVIGMAAGAVLGRDVLRPREHVYRRVASAVGLTALLVVTAFFARTRILALPVLQADRHAQAGLTHLNAKELAPAIDELTQALAIERSASTLTNRALAYSDSGELALAEGDLRDAIGIQSSPGRLGLLCDVSARLRMAKQPVSKDDLEESARQCSDAIAVAETPAVKAELLGIRAYLRHGQERLDEALADATAALAIADDHFARMVRAGIHLALGHNDEAEADCLLLLAKPAPRPFLLRLCYRVASARRDAETKRARSEEWSKAAPEDVEALLALSWSRHGDGRLAEAIAVLERAVVLDPAHSLAWNNLAWLRVIQGQFASALEAADRAVALTPDSSFNLGTRCFARVGLGDLAKARPDCVRSLEIRPDNRVDAGMLAFIDRRYTDARREWKAAIEEDPDQAPDLRDWLAKLPPR